MITGDRKNNAFAIAREFEMVDSNEQSIKGGDLDDFSDEELSEKIGSYRVFTHVSLVYTD